MTTSILEADYYIFECFLPFAISIPQKTELELTYQGHSLRFIHAERHPSKDLNVVVPADTQVTSDRFGLYVRSRVALVFDAETLRKVMTHEEANAFDLDTFFSSRFFNPSNSSTHLVVGALNRVLKLIRIVFNDWHASPLTPKDLSNLRFLKQSSKGTVVLGQSYFTHQIVNFKSDSEENQRRLAILKSGLTKDADVEPLAVMESELHDHASRGDFYLSAVMMGTLVELAIKKHLIRFLIYDKNLSLEDAEKLLKNKHGRFRNIGDFLDHQKNDLCLMEQYVGWQPYHSDEYHAWNDRVRERRNAALHSGPTRISTAEVEAAWTASCDFILLSFRECIAALLAKGVQVTEQDAMFWFSPVSLQLFPSGLIGDHSFIG